jgi:hypothetical protein
LPGVRITLEHVPRILGVARIDQKAAEVRARDEIFVRHVPHGALVRAGNAGRGQALRHEPGALASTASDGGEAVDQNRVVGVDPERHDVNRDVLPRDRELRAADEADARGLSGLLRFREAAHDVVVGQRQDIDASLRRARDDRGRRQQSIGMGRMAVEVVTRHRAAVCELWPTF